ncbi:MAG: RDD family protein, partial [Phycisphaerae bacterium]
GRPVFWALVEAADLVPPETPPASHPTGEAPLPDGDKPDETGVQAAPEHEVPEGRLALLRLRAGFWRTLPVLREADAGRVFWLSGRAGAAFLFWQTEAGEIRFARLGEEGWSAPESVCEAPDVVAGWAGAAAEGPVFVAGRGQAPERVELHVFARRSGAWTALGAAREGTEHAMIDARVAGVGIARGRLSVARLNHLGEVVFGSTDLTRSLLLRFSKLVPRLAPVRRDADWGETLVLILLMVVFTWVLLSRREQIHRPAAVPPGLAIAPVWKRLVGGLVDLTPAFVVLAVCTTFLKVSLLDLEDPVAAMEALDQPENARILQLTRAAFLASYGLWCLCWELATGSTPGKRLFGCHVLGDDGTAPTTRQIVVRNLIRVVTMTLSPAGPLLTILLMKWYTRNRQRLGDLIAHTIVVEPGPPGAVPRARPIQRDDPSDSRDDG